jgi:integrase
MAYITKVSAKNKRGYTYKYTVSLPPDPRTGKRRQKSKRGFVTKKEAELAATKVERELTEGIYVTESNITFKEHAEEWLEGYDRVKKVSTVRLRKKQLNNLLYYFAHQKLRTITKKNYQEALNDLKDSGYADNTIDGIHSCGRMIFRKAMEEDKMKVDPTEYAIVPRSQQTVEDIENEKKLPKFLEREELTQFLSAAQEDSHKTYVIFLTLAYSGMRVGELVALKWKDIDFEEHNINITKTIYNPDNNMKKYQIIPPKTRYSIREIGIEEEVTEELKKHRVMQNELRMKYRNLYHDEDFVFATTRKSLGYPELIKTIEFHMRKLLKRCGLNERLTPHSLRHTHTSLLAEAGVGLDEIMERLGHGDDKVTKRVYLHVTKRRKKEASQKFGQLMRDSEK